MGNHVVGSTKIIYTTKDGIPIEYIYYDLKGKNRFPNVPSNEKQIQFIFQRTLKEIQISQQHLQILRQFNAKYKYRFVVMHGRKVEEYKQKNQLQRLRSTKNFDDDSFKSIEESRKKELDQKLKLLENNQTAVKMHLGSIDRLISEKNLYTQFIKIDGIKRLVKILDKAIAVNKQGTKTIFQNQIQILKFMKSLSDHNPRQYFAAAANIREYAIVLMRAFHPINTAVTAYVLLMLQDYSWKVQNSLSLMQCLKIFQQENHSLSLLQPFVQTIYHTDNILMCCYNLRFINQILISIVDDREKQQLQQQLRNQRYQLLIEDIKNKLQQNFYKIEYCTFIVVSQTIYKEATKNRKEKQNIQQNLANRGTLNLQTLQQHLLVNFVQGIITNAENAADELSEEDDDDSYIQVYLAQNDKKSFNKFILDTFSEIQHYYKYTIIIDEAVQDITSQDVTEEMEKLKKHGLSVEEYLKRIKGNCLKNNCGQSLLNCFKALQYFQKNDWKKLESFINEGMKSSRNPNQLQQLKKQIEQKQKQIKNVRKEYHELKAQILNRSKLEDGIQNNSHVNKLDISFIQNNLNNQNALTAINGSSSLPPPPIFIPNLNISPPPMGIPNLPPPPMGIPNLPPPPMGIPNLPPPPSGIHNLPPPPSIIPVLPPPPSGISNLPPPPSGIPNLPPPLIGISNLPPPPSGLPNLTPLPPLIGLPSLPPPIGSPNIPSLPLAMANIPAPPPIGLPSLPGLPNLTIPGLGTQVEQKKKPKKQPKVNLKACNYIVLGYEKIKQSIWSKVDDSKVSLDQKQIEQLFARVMPKKQEIKITQSAIILPTTTKKEKVKLLGPDKHRNFQIILTKLKLPEKGIIEALTQCSGKCVIPSVLDSINKILPSEEDQMIVNSYDGTLDDLGAPERFIKEITTIPQFANRVKALIFANNKEQIYFQLQNKIQNLTTAFESLRQNYRLHHVLQVALAVGNYLNGTGIKGGAWGFRLDTIQNMQQVTSIDNKMNAAFYLIKQVWKKYTYPIFDKQEIDMYQYVQKMPTSQIKADLGQLKRSINAIQKAFNSKNKNNSNDRIDQHCEELLIQAKSKYVSLEEAVKKMDKAYFQCASFYCEDPNKAASDEIGKKIFKCVLFIFNTQKVYYELEQKRKKQEARKVPKVQMKFNQQSKTKPNPQSNVKFLPKTSSGAIKLPLPMISPIKLPEATPQEKLKQLQKTQQEKEKKFLQEIMKKRSSKMVAFRQSRMPGNNANTGKQQQQIDFLKGL